METDVMEKSQLKLEVADTAAIKQELALVPIESVDEATIDQQLNEQAQQYIDALLNIDVNDNTTKEKNVKAVETVGIHTQREAAHMSKMLEAPIRSLASKGEDGGEVANSLVDLKTQVEELDPGKFDFEPGFLGRWFGFIFGRPINRFFSRYESAQNVVAAIMRSLKEGAATLKRDNDTLREDQSRMRDVTVRLERAIQLGMLLDKKLDYALERDIAPDDARRRYVEEELLFPLRQRIQDLQQQLATNQNGVLTMEVIIRNNKELIRGVDRALNVTVTALQIAVAASLALANQKIVLEKIEAINKTTDDLILATSKQLREQGTAIHKQASSSQLNIENLKEAFRNINAAMDDISTFRREALPRMKDSISEMLQMTGQAEQTIQRMEQGNEAEQSLVIDVTPANA